MECNYKYALALRLVWENRMNMTKKLIALVLLAAAALLAACGQTPPAAETAAGADDVFRSDLTAIDYLEGTWTNNRGQYITAARGDGMLIVWETNIPLPSFGLYVLTDGVLRGGSADGEQTDLLGFSRVDGDTITVRDLVNSEESTFVRESPEADPSRLDNDYVFWSMNRAGAYLTGMWMNDAGNYFTLSTDGSSVSFNSDLPCPDCDYIDFYEGVLCGFTQNADGTVTRTPLFTFDIISEDEVRVLCHADGSESVFDRLSHELDEALLNSEYIFANNQRAFAFLNGEWKSEDGYFFRVESTGGSLTWNTNLPLDDSCSSYGFSGGGLVGTTTDENGGEVNTEIYSFRVISENELELTVCAAGDTYTLIRESEGQS